MRLKNMQLLVLAPNLNAPSLRHRIQNAFPMLEQQGWSILLKKFHSKNAPNFIFQNRNTIKSADVVYLSKSKLGLISALLLRFYARRIIYDFDDAIYFRKPKDANGKIGRSLSRQWRFYNSCRVADLVLAGNEILAKKASKASSRVQILPTPVDTAKYHDRKSEPKESFTIVWIGLPNNLQYLELVHPALSSLTRSYPQFKLRIVSSSSPGWNDVPIEFVEWSEEAEITALRSATAGIMPLTDDDWTKGKCAFKLVQYMAAGLPCIASPVGANCEVLIDQQTGYLADSTEQWILAIDTIFSLSPEEREVMGQRGQQRVEEQYSYDIIYKKLLLYLNEMTRVTLG